MSVVNITNIQVLDNPTRLGNPFQFEITFECIAALQYGIAIFIKGFGIKPTLYFLFYVRFGVEDCICRISRG